LLVDHSEDVYALLGVVEGGGLLLLVLLVSKETGIMLGTEGHTLKGFELVVGCRAVRVATWF